MPRTRVKAVQQKIWQRSRLDLRNRCYCRSECHCSASRFSGCVCAAEKRRVPLLEKNHWTAVAVSTICRLWARFEANGGVQDGAWSGRCVTTAQQVRQIYRTETSLAGMAHTSMDRPPFHCGCSVREPMPTARQRQQHLNWTLQQWHHVLMSAASVWRKCRHRSRHW